MMIIKPEESPLIVTGWVRVEILERKTARRECRGRGWGIRLLKTGSGVSPIV